METKEKTTTTTGGDMKIRNRALLLSCTVVVEVGKLIEEL
jgi:hypothetical protein